jgi:site-specific recombinase XerD
MKPLKNINQPIDWNDFEKYLQNMGYSEQTVKTYKHKTGAFLVSNPNAVNYTYQDVLNYFNVIQQQYTNANTKDSYLMAIKKYYDYLIERGIREDHPCKTLYLKKRINRNFIPGNVFTPEELHQLLEREERYEHLRLRNKVVISLLIYQGLSAGEICHLKINHIDLDKGTIYVSGNRMQTNRTLELYAEQYRMFDNYIHDARKRQLLRGKTDYLLLGFQGRAITVDDINYLVETMKPMFLDRNLTTINIRNSVIYNLLNVKKIPLEQVQLFAGHKWISTTARFLQTPTNEQRAMINKFHPLG